MVKMLINRWETVYIWTLMWFLVSGSAFATLRKTLHHPAAQSLSSIAKNDTKFGRKLTGVTPVVVVTPSATIHSVIEPTTFRPLFVRPQKIVDSQKTKEGNATREDLKNDGLLWRSMTDGKQWREFHVPETNINISSSNFPSRSTSSHPQQNLEDTSAKNVYKPGSHTYIYSPSPSPVPAPPQPHNQYHVHTSPNYIPLSGNGANPPPAAHRYNSYDSEGRTRSPRYGSPHPPVMPMSNKYQYPEQHQNPPTYATMAAHAPSGGQQHYGATPPSYAYSSPMSTQSHAGNSYGYMMSTPPSHMGQSYGYNNPMSTPSHMGPSYVYNSPMSTPAHMAQSYGNYAAPGHMMMMAPKEENGLKSMLNKLLALLPIGLLMAVAIPTMIGVPLRRSLDSATSDDSYRNIQLDAKQLKNNLSQSYPILDMIGYYGAQTFQNETCFRYIVCETVKMGGQEGANFIQKQLWTLTNRIDEKLAKTIGVKELWEGITKKDCQSFSCEWENRT